MFYLKQCLTISLAAFVATGVCAYPDESVTGYPDEIQCAQHRAQLSKLQSLDIEAHPMLRSALDTCGNKHKTNMHNANVHSTEANSNVDVTVPEFVSITFSENTIDVTNESVEVTGTIVVFEEESQIEHADLTLLSPDGVPNSQDKYNGLQQWVHDSTTNTFSKEFSFTFHDSDPGGIWSAELSYITDTADNYAWNFSANQMEELGSAPYINVINENEVDTDPPTFVSLEISTNQVDVTEAAQSIIVTLVMNDESGLQNVRYGIAAPEGVPRSRVRYRNLSNWQSGVEPNTYYHDFTLDFNRGVPAGEWEFFILHSQDTNNNTTNQSVDSEQIKALGFNTTIELINPHPVDITPPSFHSLYFNTNEINVGISDIVVTGTLTVFEEDLFPTSAYFTLYQPDGESTAFNDQKRVFIRNFKATSTPDLYSASFNVVFKPGDPVGIWRSEIYSMSDTGLNSSEAFIDSTYMALMNSKPFILNNVNTEELRDIALSADSATIADQDGEGVTKFSVSNQGAAPAPQDFDIEFELSDGLQFRSLSVYGTPNLTNACALNGLKIVCSINTNGDWDTIDTEINYLVNNKRSQSIEAFINKQSNEINLSNNKVINIIEIPNFPATKADFEGDGKANFVFRNPITNEIFIKNVLSNSSTRLAFGRVSDQSTVGDFDGDGLNDLSVFRSSNLTWYYKSSKNGKVQTALLGIDLDDIPVPADYDGDGITDFAVRSPSRGAWRILNSTDGTINSYRFGLQVDDIPLPGDYDGDGLADIAIRRPSTGSWYIRSSIDGAIRTTRFGIRPTDVPMPADYDGDDIVDIAIWRPSNGTWYIAQSSTQQIRTKRFGLNPDDIPVLGDYDDDGKNDIAIYRPSNLTWYALHSESNKVHTKKFGLLDETLPLMAPINLQMTFDKFTNDDKTNTKQLLSNEILKQGARLPETKIIKLNYVD